MYGDDKHPLAQAISDHVNSFSGGRETQKVIEDLRRDHRTLQAETVNFMMQALKAFGETPADQQDLRNQYAVKAAKAGYAAMVEALNGASRVPSV